jgi:hypothetical protein
MLIGAQLNVTVGKAMKLKIIGNLGTWEWGHLGIGALGIGVLLRSLSVVEGSKSLRVIY